MTANKVNNYSVIIFMYSTNVIYLTTIGFDLLLDNFKQSTWNVFILDVLVSIAIIFLFKGFPKKTYPLKMVFKNNFIRAIMIIYLVITSIIIIIISSSILQIYFYLETPLYIFIVLTIIVSTIVGFQSFKIIINSAFLPLLTISLFYIIPLFFLGSRDFLLLFPIDINYNKLYLSLIVLLFPIDNILFSLYAPQMKKGFTRKTLVTATIFLAIYFLYIIVDSITLMGAAFFKDVTYGGFYRWLFYKGNRFLENTNILLLIVLTITVIFRLGFYISTTRLLIKIPKKKRFMAIFAAILVILSLIINKYRIVFGKLMLPVILFLLLLILIIFSFFVKKSWEYRNE